MKTYIITYTFRDPSKDYMDFYQKVKETVDDYRHILESAWVVKTDKTAKELRDELMPFMTFENRCCDMLFISELGEDRDGMIAKSYWEFFKEEKEDDESRDEGE